MAVLGTVRVANETAYAREGVATTVIPLKRGEIPSVSPSITLTADDGGGAVDIQWKPFGPPWAGNLDHKYAIVHIPVSIPATTEKVYTIETNTATPTIFTFHPEVANWQTELLLGITLRARWATQPTSERLVLLNFSMADAVEIDISDRPTEQVVKAYRIRTRGQENAKVLGDFGYQFWGQLILEFYHNQRHATGFLSYGCHCPTVRGTSNYYPIPDIELVHNYPNGDNPGQGIFLNIVHSDPNTPIPIVRHYQHKVKSAVGANGTYAIRLINPNDSVAWNQGTNQIPANQNPNRRHKFQVGQAQRIRFTIFFGAPSGGTETDTQNAEYEDDIWALSEDWVNEDTFGPFGVVPRRPTNQYISSDAAARAAAKILDNNLYNSLMAIQPPDPWIWRDPMMTNFPNTGFTGAQSDLGASLRLWPWLCSGYPRMRLAQFSVYQEACRFSHFMEEDGRIIQMSEHNLIEPPRWTDVFIWNGRIHMLGSQANQPHPNNADTLGLVNDQVITPRSNGNFEAIAYEWRGYDRQHYTINTVAAYALATGDRHAVEEVELHTQLLLSTCQVPSLGGTRGGTDGRDAGRAVGRTAQSMVWCFLVTGDQEIFDRMIERFDETEENQYAGFGLGTVVKSYEHLPGGDGCRQWPSAVNPGAEVYVPWQDAIAIQGMYARWLLISQYPEHEAVANSMRNHIDIIGEALHRYGYTIPGSGISRCTFSSQCGSQQINSPISHGWLAGKSYRFQPLPSPSQPNPQRGDPIPDSEKYNCAQAELNSQADQWCIAGAIIGFIRSAVLGNTNWLTRVKNILGQSYIPSDPNHPARGSYPGFGNYPKDNLTENAAILKDPYLDYSGGFVDLSCVFEGENTFTTALSFSQLELGPLGFFGANTFFTDLKVQNFVDMSYGVYIDPINYIIIIDAGQNTFNSQVEVPLTYVEMGPLTIEGANEFTSTIAGILELPVFAHSGTSIFKATPHILKQVVKDYRSVGDIDRTFSGESEIEEE